MGRVRVTEGLDLSKANKLVSLFHNLRLLSRARKPNYSEPAVSWTAGEETLAKSAITKFGVDEYSAVSLKS